MSASAPTTIAVASDHGGYPLKEAIKRHLAAKGLRPLDVGTHSTEACDYPVFARAAAEAVARGEAWRGVIVDGAGIGSCMVANKVPGVRAGMAYDLPSARNGREHNDANVLTLGAGFVSEDAALKIVDVFLTTECSADRHKRRVAMIDALDASSARSAHACACASASAPPSAMAAPSAQSSPDYEALVQSIMQVLGGDPALLGSLFGAAGGAPVHCVGGLCIGCGHCVSKRTDVVRSFIGGARDVRLMASPGIDAVPDDLAKLIDHTLLRPEATYDDIDKLCDEARRYGFASVCVNPMYVKRCVDKLRGQASAVCTVIGFPLGATPSENKALEARRAIREGAREVDMVLPIGALKSGDVDYVFRDIRLVAEAAHEGRALLKVILETALLTDAEKVAACQAAKRARADFVKTSTGFSKGGATVHDVALMAKAVDHQLGVKASGGVGSAADLQKMVQAGATRIGASVGVKIVQEAKGQSGPGQAASSAGSSPGSSSRAAGGY
jgi:deoxyribose-phosphate aldolase